MSKMELHSSHFFEGKYVHLHDVGMIFHQENFCVFGYSVHKFGKRMDKNAKSSCLAIPTRVSQKQQDTECASLPHSLTFKLQDALGGVDYALADKKSKTRAIGMHGKRVLAAIELLTQFFLIFFGHAYAG